MVGRAAQLTVRNQPKRRGFTLTQVNHVLGNPCERAVRTVNPLAASTGASNHIPDQTARGSRDASSTAGSSRAYGNARLSCTRRDRPASASSIPAPAVSILAYHRVRFPEILPPSPRYKARRGRGEGEAQPGSRTAQLHRTLPPPSVLPLVLLHSALPHSARYPNTRTSHHPAGYVAGGARQERETQPEKKAQALACWCPVGVGYAGSTEPWRRAATT